MSKGNYRLVEQERLDMDDLDNALKDCIEFMALVAAAVVGVSGLVLFLAWLWHFS